MATTGSRIRPGDTVSNPVTGERFTFTHTAASTGGELLARLTRRGLPRSPLQLARLATTYDREAHAPIIGHRLQRLLLAPLAALAR
jgi:hypothetical protein